MVKLIKLSQIGEISRETTTPEHNMLLQSETEEGDVSNPKAISISIIIPVHNEERRISKSISRTLQFCADQGWDFQIIIAEDGSTDNTIRIVREFESSLSCTDTLFIVTSQQRLGKGGAIRNALSLAQKEYVAYMDADLSADPAEFRKLIENIKNCDVAIGSRKLPGNLPPANRPFTRMLFSFFYSALFRMLFRIPVQDLQCGFKLFKRNAAEILFNDLRTSKFAFDSEIIVRAFISGLKVKEVPITWIHDRSSSKIRIVQQAKDMGRDLLSIWYQSHILLHNRRGKKETGPRWRLIFCLVYLFKRTDGKDVLVQTMSLQQS
jgi:glycosyltransferase involved in cell wall biosynthesis